MNTTTGAQRYNKRMDKIFESYRNHLQQKKNEVQEYFKNFCAGLNDDEVSKLWHDIHNKTNEYYNLPQAKQ